MIRWILVLILAAFASVALRAQQTGVPIADNTVTGCVQNTGDGDGDTFDELDETTAAHDSGGTDWEAAGTTACLVNETVTSLTDPSSSVDHSIGSVMAQSTGGKDCDLYIALYESTTVRACVGCSALTLPSGCATDDVTFCGFAGGYTEFNLTLSGAQADAITTTTGYQNLRVESHCTKTGGGPGRTFHITAQDVIVPSASGGGDVISIAIID